jgi:uncharacterized membrane-anchored protein
MIRWYRRMAALVSAAVIGALLPAVAWAHTDPVAVAVGDELAKRKVKVGRGLGAAGALGTICCLAVIAVIVIAVVLLLRRRSK